jgi:hypothetical protein
MSAEGEFVAFEFVQQDDVGNQLFSLWRWDRVSGTLTDLGFNDPASVFAPQITGDGHAVLFRTDALYVLDVASGRASKVDTNAFGQRIQDMLPFLYDISEDGRYISFSTKADDVVAGDTNGAQDVFVRAFPEPSPASVSPSSVPRGSTTTITLTGHDFVATPTVTMGNGVTVDSVTWVSESQLTVAVTVAPEASTGARDVVVRNLGTGPGPNSGATGICGNCLTIT